MAYSPQSKSMARLALTPLARSTPTARAGWPRADGGSMTMRPQRGTASTTKRTAPIVAAATRTRFAAADGAGIRRAYPDPRSQASPMCSPASTAIASAARGTCPPREQGSEAPPHEHAQRGKTAGPAAVAPSEGRGRHEEHIGEALHGAEEQRLPFADLGTRHRRRAPEEWQQAVSPGIEPSGQHAGPQNRDDRPHRQTRGGLARPDPEPAPGDLDRGPDPQHAQPGQKPGMEVRPEREERRRGIQPSRLAPIHRPEQEEDGQEEHVGDEVRPDRDEEGH